MVRKYLFLFGGMNERRSDDGKERKESKSKKKDLGFLWFVYINFGFGLSVFIKTVGFCFYFSSYLIDFFFILQRKLPFFIASVSVLSLISPTFLGCFQWLWSISHHNHPYPFSFLISFSKITLYIFHEFFVLFVLLLKIKN